MEKNKIHVYLYNTLIVLCLLGGAAYVISQFMHFGSGEFTDNARVRQNIVPQSSRVQGFIREVRFTDFQQVKKGDTLVIIEDAEFRLRLAQAEAERKVVEAETTAKADVLAQEAGVYADERDYVRARLYAKTAPQVRSVLVGAVPDGVFGLPVKQVVTNPVSAPKPVVVSKNGGAK